MLRFRCSGDVPKRDAASPPPGTGQTSPIGGKPKAGGGESLARPRWYAAISLLLRRPQESFGLVRASAKILRPRSHGLNFWPPESVGEDFFIDGLVAPPSPSVVLCSRASPLLICELQGLSSGWISEPQRGPTVAEFVTGSVQLKSKLMLGASVK